MKYLINLRGRALSVSDKDFEKFLSIGYQETTQQDYNRQKYYPQFDRGSGVVKRPTVTKIPENEKPVTKDYIPTVEV